MHRVWATDSTYAPMKHMYLMAVIDLHSWYVLKYSVSNTMAAEWRSRVLSETLDNYPTTTIFNTDQDSQFTALFVKASVQMALAIGGKGQALDNIFVEGFWRTVKYESGRRADIYLKACVDGWQLEADRKSVV